MLYVNAAALQIGLYIYNRRHNVSPARGRGHPRRPGHDDLGAVRADLRDVAGRCGTGPRKWGSVTPKGGGRTPRHPGHVPFAPALGRGLRTPARALVPAPATIASHAPLVVRLAGGLPPADRDLAPGASARSPAPGRTRELATAETSLHGAPALAMEAPRARGCDASACATDERGSLDGDRHRARGGQRPLARLGGAERLPELQDQHPGYKRQERPLVDPPVPKDMRLNAIHAALLHTGKVLIIAGSGNNLDAFKAGTFKSLLWDPGHRHVQADPHARATCSAQATPSCRTASC